MRRPTAIICEQHTGGYGVLKEDDPETAASLRELFELARRPQVHFALWVGAGASVWAGYPSWQMLADEVIREFKKYSAGFDWLTAQQLSKNGELPAAMGMCSEFDRKRFCAAVSKSLSPREASPLYRRFVSAVSSLRPRRVLTTNIERSLEEHLGPIETFGLRDVDRARVADNAEWICKLHGGLEAFDSTVLTAEDYSRLKSDSRYLSVLDRLLSQLSVIFIGYGLRDEHLLQLLSKAERDAVNIGTGPHFLISPDVQRDLPRSIRMIRYKKIPHEDHRAALSVIEEVANLRNSRVEAMRPDLSPSVEPRHGSAHMLFHLLPPGTWETSQTAQLINDRGESIEIVIGDGHDGAEFKGVRSTAMHDVAVGLLCFDQVLVPISYVARLHDLLNSDRFWRLVDDGALGLVHWPHQCGVLFPRTGAICGGSVGSFTVAAHAGSPVTVESILRQQLRPSQPSYQSAFDRRIANLVRLTKTVPEVDDGAAPYCVRSLLLRPSVRRLIGMSEAVQSNSIARWHMFPVLRLASVVKTGLACRTLGIESAKLGFGAASLAGAAFSATWNNDWADDVASYAVCGRFASEIGTYVMSDMARMDAIIAMRNTAVGRELRCSIRDMLADNKGSDVEFAINGALRGLVPRQVLERARESFVSLSTPDDRSIRTAVWEDPRISAHLLAQWKSRSRQILRDHVRSMRIGGLDECPCGSGEKLKFCCSAALSGE